MNKRFLTIVVVLLSAVLLGIILVQFLWIRSAVKIKEEQFNRSVYVALRDVVDRMETYENYVTIANKLVYSSGDSLELLVTDSIHFDYVKVHMDTIGIGIEEHNIVFMTKKGDGEEALKTIWGDDNYFTTRSMDVYITKLRKYIKDDKSIEIVNVHGSGFRLIES